MAIYKVIIQYNKLRAYYTEKQWMGVEEKMLHFYIMFSPTELNRNGEKKQISKRLSCPFLNIKRLITETCI